MVMGIDSHSEGHGFESQHHILDGHFFTYICCKNCNVCLKRPKIREKEAGFGPFLSTIFFNNSLDNNDDDTWGKDIVCNLVNILFLLTSQVIISSVFTIANKMITL